MEKILVAKIGSPMGIKGFVKIHSFTEPKDNVFLYPLYIEEKLIKIETWKHSGKNLIAKFANTTTRNHAELLVGKELYTDKSVFKELEEGEYYVNDLIGLKVLDEEKNLVGKVSNFFNINNQNIIEIKKNDNKELDLIFNKENIKDIDIQNGFIIVCLPEIV